MEFLISIESAISHKSSSQRLRLHPPLPGRQTQQPQNPVGGFLVRGQFQTQHRGDFTRRFLRQRDRNPALRQDNLQLSLFGVGK